MQALYFVRHGETDWNAERRLQGRRDIPLNETGRRQSARCAAILGNLLGGTRQNDFAFIASPLSRARQTMEIIRTGLALTPHDYAVDHRLAEMSFGRWEGLNYREIKAAYWNVLAERDHDKWNFRPPEGETYAELLLRVRQWHDAVARPAIIVAHGGVGRALMVLFDISGPSEATNGEIAQGVVYQFSARTLCRHE
jgi:broad specificity phosphatase PhoE